MSRKNPALRLLPLVAAFAAVIATPPQALADEIVLKDGSRVLGTITGLRDGLVTIETSFAGTLEVSLDQVDSLDTEDPVITLLSDGSVYGDQALAIENGTQLSLGESTFPVENLDIVNPEPWEMGIGYNWTGLVNVAFAMERGNTDTDELDYKLDTQWVSTRDRFTVRWQGEIDEANGEKSADNWQAQLKYDYFLTDPNYWGVHTLAEKDKFQDLKLRYLVGPYYGRQISTDPLLTLQAEVGASYVDEDFDVAEDDDYPAGNWSFKATSNLLGGDSSLYFDQLGIWNLDETSDVIVNSTFGLSFPLLFDFEAAAEVVLEYDSGAVDDVDDLEEKYYFRIGYTW